MNNLLSKVQRGFMPLAILLLAGAFIMTGILTFAPQGDVFADDPVCGDGVVEGDEECDDAGETTTCDANCTFVSCGDGDHNATAGEECDDGGESADCDDDCSLPECGDGNYNVQSGEECDGGNDCSSVCECENITNYVTHVGDTWEVVPHSGNSQCDADNVQYAVDESDGETVFLEGTFDFKDDTVFITKGVTLKGETVKDYKGKVTEWKTKILGGGINTLGIEFHGAFDVICTGEHEYDQVIISDLSISTTETGIYHTGGGNLEVDSCEILSGNHSGGWPNEASVRSMNVGEVSLVIKNNELSSGNGGGGDFGGGDVIFAGLSNHREIEIADNTLIAKGFHTNQNAVEVWYNFNPDSKINIHNNTMEARIPFAYLDSQSSSVVTDNTMKSNGGVGILYNSFNKDGGIIKGNTIETSGSTPIFIGFKFQEADYVEGLVIKQNIFNGTGLFAIAAYEFGALNRSHNNTIINNDLSNFTAIFSDIYLGPNTYDNVIINNSDDEISILDATIPAGGDLNDGENIILGRLLHILELTGNPSIIPMEPETDPLNQ